jgi:prepilin-type N-terminal cleavage/methylation domain-containing protein
MDPMKNNDSRCRRSAFTLIELLTVISIIAILMAMTIAIISYAQDKAAEERTKSVLIAVKAGLERYNDEYGEYPEPVENSGTGKSGSVALYQALMDDGDDEILGGPNEPSDGRTGENMFVDVKSKGFVDGEGSTYWIKDGYDRKIYYQVYDPENPEATNQTTYDLWSYGKDKGGSKADTDNEALWIKNW